MYEALKDDIKAEIKDIIAGGSAKVGAESTEDVEIKFGYCTEFIVLGDAKRANELQSQIENMGDSMIIKTYSIKYENELIGILNIHYDDKSSYSY